MRQFTTAYLISVLSGIRRAVCFSAVMALSAGGAAIAQPNANADAVPVLLAQTSGGSSPSELEGTRFNCQFVNNEYVVMYSPQSQPGRYYPWAKPGLLGGGWTPELRCNEISRRLESYRPDGLQEMRTGIENGYDIVCVTTQRDPNCRIVLTVPPGQDPIATRDRVFENLTVADSGQRTDAVTTFADDDRDILGQIGEALNISLPNLSSRSRAGSSGLDLRPFLDRADGGTGTQLRQTPQRLNPDLFR